MQKRVQHIVSIVVAVLFLATSMGVNRYHYCCDLCAEHGSRMFTHECCCAEVHHNHAHHQHATKHCCTHHHNDALEHHGHTTYTAQENSCYLEHFDISTFACSHIDFHFDMVTWCSNFINFEALVAVSDTHFKQFFSHAPPDSSGRDILTKVSVLTI